MLRNNDNSAEAQVSFWARNPLVPPAIALCAGIWLGRYLRLGLAMTLVIAGALILAAITTRALRLRRASIPLLLAIAALGLARYHVSLIHPADPLPSHSVEGLLRGKVCEQPQVFRQQNRTRVVLDDCVWERKDGGTEQLPYNVMLSISTDTRNLWPMSSLKFDESDSRHFTKATASTMDPQQHLNYGDRLEAQVRIFKPSGVRNPGRFDAREYYARRGIMRQAYCSSESTVSVAQAHDQGLFSKAVNLLWSWRRDFRSLIEDTCDWQHVPMMKALILGDRTGITTDHYDQLQRIGVAHIIAISGMHVGFVAFFFYALFKWLSPFAGLSSRGISGLRLTCAATAAPVLFYAVLAGPRHASVRAAIVVLCWLLALALDRDRQVLNFLALAAIVILTWKPGAIFEAGFQLSFVAATGMTVAFQYILHIIHNCIGIIAPTLPFRVKEALRSLGMETPLSRGPTSKASSTMPVKEALRSLFKQLKQLRFSHVLTFKTYALSQKNKMHLRLTIVRARPWSPLHIVRKLMRLVAALTIASLVAIVSTAPLAALWFGRVSLVGLFANLYVVLIATLLVPLLLLAFAVFPASEFASDIMLRFADSTAWLMDLVSNVFSNPSLRIWRLLVSTPCIIAYAVFALVSLRLWVHIVRPARAKQISVSAAVVGCLVAVPPIALTYGSWSVPRPSLATSVAYYVTLILACCLFHKPSHKRAVATSVAALVLISSVFAGARWPSDLLRVAFLDVGRGFSCVVEAPGGKVVVIDGGGSVHRGSEVGRNVLLPYLRHRDIKKIDHLVLSNPHSERIDGLFSLLSEADSGSLGGLQIGHVVFRDFDCASRKYRKFRSTIDELELPVTEIGNQTGLKLLSFAENSLVVRLEFGQFSILFLSDPGRISQTLLSEYRNALKSTILVVPEGFETSVSSKFMALVSPDALVVSGADQRWRRPPPTPLQYEIDKGRILKTDELHCIIIESDGRSWRALTPFAENVGR